MKKKITGIIYLLLCLVVVFHMKGLITDYPITSDAAQNLRMSYNLYKSGVLSNDGDKVEQPTPTNYREPIPPIVSAAFMTLHPAFHKNITLDSIQNGPLTKVVKQVNLFWVFILMAGIGLLSYQLTNNKLVPFLVFLFVFAYFIRFGNHFNTFNTELPTAVLMIWGSIFIVKLKEQITFLKTMGAGILIGLLILTKAVFLYILPIVFLFLVCLLMINEINISNKHKVLMLAVFSLGVLFVVSPWLIRNKIHFGQYEITQRGGTVLYMRANYNKMEPDEIMASFYYYGPYLYKTLSDKFLDAPSTEDFEIDGKYQRINRGHTIDGIASSAGLPDLAVSFRGKIRAEREQLQRIYAERNYTDPKKKADEILGEKAQKMILNKPGKHILMTIPFFWRGMWCFPNPTVPLLPDNVQRMLHEAVNFLSYLSLFFLFVAGVYKIDFKILGSMILPVGMLLFYALFSHNIPRYSEAAIPFLLIIFAIILAQIFFKTISNFFPNNEIIEIP